MMSSDLQVEQHDRPVASGDTDLVQSPVLPSECTLEAPDTTSETHGTDGSLPGAVDLIETELTAPGTQTGGQASMRAGSGGAGQRPPLPVWEYVNVDKILPDPSIEPALRSAGIDRIHRASTGFLAEGGIRLLARIEPIYLRRCDNNWYCYLGWDLVQEAQRVLPAPRRLPVCVYADMTPEETRDSMITEQIIVPLRHRITKKALNLRVSMMLNVVHVNTHLFAELGTDQWARVMDRTLRWLRYRIAESKRGKK